MSQFDQHYNKDLSFLRSVIVGFLSILQNKLSLVTQIGAGVEDIKTDFIKFYFSTTGSERFLNDNFLNSVEFDPNYILAEAFYAELPRGLVDFTGVSIESDSITNKYIRTSHKIMEPGGSLNTYNSETFFVPLNLKFTLSIYIGNMIDQLKIAESLIRNLYKNLNFKIEHEYNLIQCVASLPEDNSIERPVEFSFSDKKEYKIEADVEVRTYMPVFIPLSTLFEGNRMETLTSTVNLVKDQTIIESDIRTTP